MSAPQRNSILKQRALRWSIELLGLLAVFWVLDAWQTRDLPRGTLPAFTLQALDGSPHTDTMLAGKPTLLIFWAPWCGVCQVQSQNVSWLQSMLGTRARVLSVASSYRELGEVHAYVSAHAVDYPVLLGSRATLRAFRVRAFPTVFFLDSEGKIKRVASGYTTTFGLLWRLLL